MRFEALTMMCSARIWWLLAPVDSHYSANICCVGTIDLLQSVGVLSDPNGLL